MTRARPVALLLHGAGTAPGSALRLLADAVPSGQECIALPHDGDVGHAVAAIERTAYDDALALRTAGGISVGAHAVAAWAARATPGLADPPDLVLAMPAWTGAPDPVAALTRASADEIEAGGVDAVLDRLLAEAGGDWVVDELVLSWRGRDAVDLARALRAAAASAAPTADDLARIRARTVVVALADDPLHPVAVAEEWAGAIPGARLAVVAREAPGLHRGALGAAAREVLDAWA